MSCHKKRVRRKSQMLARTCQFLFDELLKGSVTYHYTTTNIPDTLPKFLNIRHRKSFCTTLLHTVKLL